ncbi:hypothetical protein [Streptomyces sp. NPDC048659]|uniref:hypothetical protein n=1 Tax=Streptomyces sp. NPDC048659 TaxID=3155489 RepID=UPI00343B44B5
MTRYVRVSWQGDRQWTARGRRLASRGLGRAAEHVLSVSNQRVPLEEGTLERSGRAAVNDLEATISYDTPYAVRQHEELTWRHLPGRRAKYLESAMNDSRETALRLMAVPLRAWLRG